MRTIAINATTPTRHRSRRRLLGRALALALLTGAGTVASVMPVDAKPINTFLGRDAVRRYCSARGGTYTSIPGVGYTCEYVDRDGLRRYLDCPESGVGCEWIFIRAKQPTGAASVATAPISTSLTVQQEEALTAPLIAEQVRISKAAKAAKAKR